MSQFNLAMLVLCVALFVGCNDPKLAVASSESAAVDAPGQQDTDRDGVKDVQDNCVYTPNPAQDDTDQDKCGNVCDGDFDQDGIVGYPDFGQMSAAVGSISPNFDVTEPIGDVITPEDVLNVWVPMFGQSGCNNTP